MKQLVKTPIWAKTTHRCPVCGKPIINFQEYLFIKSEGMCLGCEHVSVDVTYNKMVDACEMAGISVEEYEEAING